MIAEHLAELLALQNENDISFLYEAAVCGSIPIIRNLEEYYDNDLLQSVSGIVNGSTNYILTKYRRRTLIIKMHLHNAQQLVLPKAIPLLTLKELTQQISLLFYCTCLWNCHHPKDSLQIWHHATSRGDANYATEKACRSN